MTDRVEITDSSTGQPRIVPVEGRSVVIGSGLDAGIVVPGLDATALRLVETDRGYRAEPGRPGATLVVNGEALYAKELVVGDVIDLGVVRLRWLSGPRAALPPPVRVTAAPVQQRAASQPSPAREVHQPAQRPPPAHQPASPKPPRRPSTPRPAPSRQPRPRRRSPAPVMIGVLLAVVVGVAMMLRACAGSTWPKTPQFYVDLARSQFVNGRYQDALGTLQFALGEAQGPAREQALALQQQINRALAVASDASLVQAARSDLALLRSFVTRYLQADPGSRPAARELLRQCRAWQQQHGVVAGRDRDAGAMATEVEALRQRFAAAAHEGEADTQADVLFAATAQLRFQRREYKAAMRILDDYLAGHPDAADVRAARAEMLASGAEWLQQKLRLVDQLIGLQRFAEAQKELRALQQVAELPEWRETFAAREGQLQGH